MELEGYLLQIPLPAGLKTYNTLDTMTLFYLIVNKKMKS
jgi:hypothetical protein